ncbi:hypothetical protein GJU40_13415 [Bacillus lacus]|uniref:methylmalonyl-CoA mutase n=1 Tax=Metabacillus lacus TaxID=1983721 RepID=A0A7X2J0E5_9BACI|nr:methylmalonyl-CoA mutase family protein [Metabacillus lacus]MRX73142.1 hypothetical protein [Metabacillus lacus]
MNKHEKNHNRQAPTEEAWRTEVEKTLKGKSADSLVTSTYEGITLQPLYTQNNSKQLNDKWELPGKPENVWHIAQKLTAANLTDLRSKLQAAYERGQTSLSIGSLNFLNSVDAITYLLKDLSVNHFTIDAGRFKEFLPVFSAYVSGQHTMEAGGVIGFDPFESLLHNQEEIEALSENIKLLTDFSLHLAEKDIKIRPFFMKGDSYHEMGANAVQELAYTFGAAVDLLNTLRENHQLSERTFHQFAFSYSTGTHFFIELAKLRAAKEIWAGICEAFEQNPETCPLYLHANTSDFYLTKYDLEMNMLRSTTQAFSAAAAGVDSLTILPYDKEILQTGARGERIARNTHYLLQEENLLARVSDPAAGSWYVEAITRELADEAWKAICQLEESGGFTAVLNEGGIHEELASSFAERLKDVNTRKREIIGVNIYSNLKEQPRAFKEATAAPGFSPAFDFSEAYHKAKKGEKLTVNREEGKADSAKRRLAGQFEDIRQRAEQISQKQGAAPALSVLTIGSLKEYKPRLDYLSGLFAAGGIVTERADFHEEHQSLHNIAVICGNDSAYQSLSVDAVKRLRDSEGAEKILIAGKQSDELLKTLGISGEIYAGMDIFSFLDGILQDWKELN